MLLLVKTVKRQVAGASVLARWGKGMEELIKPGWLLLFFCPPPPIPSTRCLLSLFCGCLYLSVAKVPSDLKFWANKHTLMSLDSRGQGNNL